MYASLPLSARHARLPRKRDEEHWEHAARGDSVVRRREAGARGLGIETCAGCGGRLRIIASIEEPEVITRILSRLEGTGSGQEQPQLPLGARLRSRSCFESDVGAAGRVAAGGSGCARLEAGGGGGPFRPRRVTFWRPEGSWAAGFDQPVRGRGSGGASLALDIRPVINLTGEPEAV